MKYHEFVRRVSKRAGYTQEVTKLVLNAAVDVITESTKHKERVVIPRLGTFRLTEREPRIYYNRHSGERRMSLVKHHVSFVPSKLVIWRLR